MCSKLSPHFSRAVKTYLDHRFPGELIGRCGPQHRPPRTPDLKPLDFYL
jgi:hypothetical protein